MEINWLNKANVHLSKLSNFTYGVEVENYKKNQIKVLRMVSEEEEEKRREEEEGVVFFSCAFCRVVVGRRFLLFHLLFIIRCSNIVTIVFNNNIFNKMLLFYWKKKIWYRKILQNFVLIFQYSSRFFFSHSPPFLSKYDRPPLVFLYCIHWNYLLHSYMK